MTRISRLSLLLCLGMAFGAASPVSAQEPVSIDTTPYQETLTEGMLCFSEDDLKSALAAFEAKGLVSDVQCIALPPGYSQEVTATPLEHYKNGSIDGIITQYTVDDGRAPAYGIAKIPGIDT